MSHRDGCKKDIKKKHTFVPQWSAKFVCSEHVHKNSRGMATLQTLMQAASATLTPKTEHVSFVLHIVSTCITFVQNYFLILPCITEQQPGQKWLHRSHMNI